MRLRHPVIFGLFIGVSTVVAAALVLSNGPISETSSATITLDGAIGVNMKPSLTLREFTAIDSEQFAVLEFGNPTTRTIYFYGYGPEYPRQWFERRSNGKWIASGWHWCGVDMELRELAPGRTIRFTVGLSEYTNFWEQLEENRLDHKSPLRVGIEYGIDKDAVETRIWCDLIDVPQTSHQKTDAT